MASRGPFWPGPFNSIKMHGHIFLPSEGHKLKGYNPIDTSSSRACCSHMGSLADDHPLLLQGEMSQQYLEMGSQLILSLRKYHYVCWIMCELEVQKELYLIPLFLISVWWQAEACNIYLHLCGKLLMMV